MRLPTNPAVSTAFCLSSSSHTPGPSPSVDGSGDVCVWADAQLSTGSSVPRLLYSFQVGRTDDLFWCEIVVIF